MDRETFERLSAMLDEANLRDAQNAVPNRLKSIREYVAKIRADPSDIRSTPDLRPAKGGGTYIHKLTSMNHVERQAMWVQEAWDAGDRDIARYRLDQLNATLVRVNARKDAPFIETGRKVKQAASDGHAKVHGTPEEKAERQRGYVAAWDRARSTGLRAGAADSLVAEQFGVSSKTIQRARSGDGKS